MIGLVKRYTRWLHTQWPAGVGLHIKDSGRVGCRFICPLAALMHVFARFSRFRIVPDEKKCVRYGAGVQLCPTGVLQFGQVDRKTGRARRLDWLPASPVIMAEGTQN